MFVASQLKTIIVHNQDVVKRHNELAIAMDNLHMKLMTIING